MSFFFDLLVTVSKGIFFFLYRRDCYRIMRCADFFFRFFVAKVKIYVLRLLPTHEDIKYLMFSFNGYRLLSKYRTMILFDI